MMLKAISMLRQEVQHARSSRDNIDFLPLNRRSPTSMSCEELVDRKLMRLLEAARRVFASFNNQMWRFIYAKRNTAHWTQLLDLLCEGNRIGAKDIAALVVVGSRTTFEDDGRHPITHQFGADAVWQNFALEGSIQGIVTHSMKGFDYEKARRRLAIPFICNVVMAIIAIGRRRSREKLPARLQGTEFADGIRPLLEVVMAVGSLRE